MESQSPRRRRWGMGGAGTTTADPLSRWLTALAFVAVSLPFVVVLARLFTESASGITLPDDLALIDLHTRDAIHWQQQLGVFDRFGWNHPGPAYFYWLSIIYRILGSGPRALFVGSALLNGLVAVACLEVVRRRATPARTMWAALWLVLLTAVLATTGPASTTYSESALGGLVSPWNPMVVIFPMVLLVLLAASAVEASLVSWLGAVAVGSFAVQTDISTLPLVVAVLFVSGTVILVTWVRERRRAPRVDPPAPVGRGPRGRRRLLGVGSMIVIVTMWVPPVLQQLTNTPGNMGLIVRFFTARHPGQPIGSALWATSAAFSTLVVGPSEVMSELTGAPDHAVVVAFAGVVVLLLGAATTVLGTRGRHRFAAALGGLTLAGTAAVVASVTDITGYLFGYLVVWAVALPVVALIAAGMGGSPPWTSRPAFRTALCVAVVALSTWAVVRITEMPPLSAASDPQVSALTKLVKPRLESGEKVTITDNAAGRSGTNELLDLERFIGLVDQLDRLGYQPRVSPFWTVQFGPRLVQRGPTTKQVVLSTWDPGSSVSSGYVGRVGNMAVTVAATAGSSRSP